MSFREKGNIPESFSPSKALIGQNKIPRSYEKRKKYQQRE
jgi:hypothetical protein